MAEIYNVYCDESCHLEHDNQQVMVLGAIWCPSDEIRNIGVRVREIKKRHRLSQNFEIKWTKISPAKKQFYIDLIDYFFDDNDLHFRALIVPDKDKLRHDFFNQSHDDFYYKMYFDMLKVILNPNARYRIFLDIKDTRGATKVKKLHSVLCNSIYDFSRQILKDVQTIRSHESEILQLTDLLVGAMSYVNRGLNSSEAKLEIVKRISERSHYSLTRTTLLREEKINIFVWDALETQE